MDPKLNWSLKKFAELTIDELYEILRLRSEVFVVEQKSIFADMDYKDQKCHHLLGHLNGELLAYSRIVPEGISYDNPSIGRIVVSRSGRTIGLGKALMRTSLESLENLYGQKMIRIGAQLYLQNFYASFGFVRSSEPYDDGGIEHIEMTRSPF